MNDDLSDAFRLALQHASSWTPEISTEAVNLLFDRIAAATDDWDASSGEEWVQFIANGSPILYLRVDFPLAFVLSGAEMLLEGIGVVVLTVDSFDDVRFSIHPSLLSDIFSHQNFGVLNPASFTVHELWQAAT